MKTCPYCAENIQNEAINPMVHERIPLAEAARGHQLLESGLDAAPRIAWIDEQIASVNKK